MVTMGYCVTAKKERKKQWDHKKRKGGKKASIVVLTCVLFSLSPISFNNGGNGHVSLSQRVRRYLPIGEGQDRVLTKWTTCMWCFFDKCVCACTTRNNASSTS